MKWILVFLDKVFGNLFGNNEWFRHLAARVAENVASKVYSFEGGNADWAGLAEKIGRVVRWLPVVFLVCVVIDIAIRSRFVRYSYRDEQQAKKTTWWQWQSDVDAAVALESGSRQGELAEHAGADGTVAEGEEAAEEAAPADAAPAAQELPEEEIDRGPVTNARQNRVRGNAPISERMQGRMTDLRNRAIVAASALKFAPNAVKRDARLRGERVRSAATMRVAAQEERRMRRNSSEQELAAENAAVLDTELQNTVMDGSFTQESGVETGGIQGYSFGAASAVISEALGSWATDPVPAQAPVEEAEAPVEEIAAEETETVEEPVIEEIAAEESVEEEFTEEEVPAEEYTEEEPVAEEFAAAEVVEESVEEEFEAEEPAEEPVEEEFEAEEPAEESVEEEPAEVLFAEEAEPAEEEPVEEEPVEAYVEEEAFAEETPVEEEPEAEAAAVEFAAEEEPAEEPVEEELPVEEAFVAEELPAEEAPVEDELPVEEPAAEELPEEAPAAEETEDPEWAVEIPEEDPPFVSGASAAELRAVEDLLGDEASAAAEPVAEEPVAAEPVAEEKDDVDDVEADVEHLAETLDKLRRGIGKLFKKKND